MLTSIVINDDGHGGGFENITFKTNSRFFKLCRVYSSSLKMWKVGGISLELICWGSHLSLERGRKIRLRLVMSFTKRQNRHFHVVVVHCKKEMYKKAWSRAKYAFLFLCSLCRRRTLGARDFSSAVSGFCQVFIVTRRSWIRPTAEDVSALSQHRKFTLHARKTSGTQGTVAVAVAKAL